MRATRGEKWFYRMNGLLLALFGLSCLLPILHLGAMSFSASYAIETGKVGLWPVGWTLESYIALLKGSHIIKSFYNNIVITVVGTSLNIVFTILGAYPLSRKYFYGRRVYMLAIVFTMLFNGGIIPSYLLVKALGLLNTYWAIWLPVLVSVWNLLIMRTFFQNIPEELEDAARMDGCSEFRLVSSIYIPLSLPVIATLALFYGVAHWNNFMSVLFYINDASKHNLTVHVQNMMQNTRLLEEMSGTVPEVMSLPPEGVKSAGIFILIIPMLLVYPFLQRYFVKGMMIGSLKG